MKNNLYHRLVLTVSKLIHCPDIRAISTITCLKLINLELYCLNIGAAIFNIAQSKLSCDGEPRPVPVLPQHHVTTDWHISLWYCGVAADQISPSIRLYNMSVYRPLLHAALSAKGSPIKMLSYIHAYIVVSCVHMCGIRLPAIASDTEVRWDHPVTVNHNRLWSDNWIW